MAEREGMSYRGQLDDCRDRLRAVVSGSGGAHAAAMICEAKLLRATLVFASGSPLGAFPSTLLPAAVSIELLHLASLVHDDIIDEATERRGVPALHVTAGSDRALVVGDLLIVSAFDAIGELREAVPAEIFAGCFETLSKGAQLCCFGQLEELYPRNGVLSEGHYLDVAAKKTGSLFSVAASLGALVAGAGGEERAALAALGTQLGVAYQIRDDLRDGAERSGRAGDGGRFSPTSVTYDRAVDAVRGALGRVPSSCGNALQTLVEGML